MHVCLMQLSRLCKDPTWLYLFQVKKVLTIFFIDLSEIFVHLAGVVHTEEP